MAISTISQKGLDAPITLTSPVINTITSAPATALTLQSAGTTAVTIDTAQNVGIGAISPAAKLEINSTTAQLNITDNTSTGNGNKTVNLQALKNGVGYHNLNYTAYQHVFLSGGSVTEAMRIDTATNVGANVVPWTGITNSFNYQTGVKRFIASGAMSAGTWANTSLVLTSSNGFIYTELVAIGNENSRNNGIRVYTIMWNPYDGWQTSLKYNSQQGNDYGQVDVQMNGSTVQVKAVNNASGGPYRLFLQYYLY